MDTPANDSIGVTERQTGGPAAANEALGPIAAALPPAITPAALATAASTAPPPETFGGLFKAFDALKVRNFQFYSLSGVFHMAAMNMQQLANGWFAYHLTGSSAVLGLTLLAQAIPQVCLSFVGGVVSDRVPRRLLMQMVFGINALLSLWIAVSAQLGFITWQDLVVRSFVFGCALAFLMPSRQGIIGELVGRGRIMSAISVNQALGNVMQFAGPAIAGFLIAGVSIQGAYYVITGLFVCAALAMVPVCYMPRKVVSKAGLSGFLGNIMDGLKYVRTNRNVMLILLISLLTVTFSMPYNQLLPVFAKDVLGVGPERLGLLSSLGGVGALIGSTTVAFMQSKKRGLLFIYSGLLLGLGLVAFCISNSYAISAAIALAVGAGQAIRMTLSMTLLQTYTDDAYMGRVLSINMMQMGLTSLAGFGVAVFAEAIGVQRAVGMTSLLLLVTVLGFWLFSPRMRKLA